MMARLLLLVLLVGVVVFGTAWLWIPRDETGETAQVRNANLTTQRVIVPLAKEDTPLVLPLRGNEAVSFDRAIGGVVPHHLVASSFLAEFFALLSERSVRPKAILLMAPNHFEKGEATIQTTDVTWDTPFGVVESDPELLQAVLRGGATLSPNTFIEEHGVYNILPYIAHFLPDTRVVPVVFRYQMSTLEREQLVESVMSLIRTGEVFVVSSIDFSHYLSQEEAEMKDEETLEALHQYDMNRIARYGSDHLDSPGSLLTLLRIGQELEATDITVLRHGNSADSIRGRNSSTTSHFTLFLSKEE
jgi:AmmeMemoRadiSam system protein B